MAKRMTKGNIRSFRFTDEVAEIINNFPGKNMSEKLDGLILAGTNQDGRCAASAGQERMDSMKPNNQITGNVYKTTDYEQFVQLVGNRDITRDRLAKIEASMLIKQLPIPIVVNEKMEVIDGQGRLAVCKKHGMPVWYCVCPGLDINDCLTVNINSTKWSEVDILNRYAKTGNPHYQRLLNVMKEFSVNAQTAMLASGHGLFETSKREKMKNGECVFTEEDLEVATRNLKMGNEIINAIAEVKSVGQRAILRGAIVRCAKTEGYDHERMLASCKKCAITYQDFPKLSVMMQQLAQFYNRGRRAPYMDSWGEGAAMKVVFDAEVNRYAHGK